MKNRKVSVKITKEDDEADRPIIITVKRGKNSRSIRLTYKETSALASKIMALGL